MLASNIVPPFFSTSRFHPEDTTRIMSGDEQTEQTYTFWLSDLPKLDLQVDKGTDFTMWRIQ